MRLVHKLFLLFSLTTMIAALAMAGVLAWNLDRGFTQYLQARDAEGLEKFAGDFEEYLAETGITQPTLAQGDVLKSVFRQMEDSGRITGSRFGPPRQLTDGTIAEDAGPPPLRPPPPGNADEREGPPDADGGKRGPPPEGFGQRLRLFDASGDHLLGPPTATAEVELRAATIPIKLNGTTVANASLLPRGPTPQSIDSGFLTGQYTGVAVVTVLLLILSGALAWVLARAAVAKFAALENATAAIASGDFNARIDATGGDEIAAMGLNINAMAESLGRLESARKRWLADISHELRTPLTILRGELDALEEGIRPLEMKAVRSLSEEAERLHALIEDLHFLAVSDIGFPTQRYIEVDAVELAHDVAERFDFAMRDAGLELMVECSGLSTLPVIWDGPKVEQLLGNLMTNSIRYTDAPGKVCLRVSDEGEHVRIEVEDSAPGVPIEHMERLFEPLHRLEEARDRISGGSGLGLAVAEAIAVAHHGKITATPCTLGGLRIALLLPINAGRP